MVVARSLSHGESNLSHSATDTPLSSTDWFNIDSQFKDISLPIRLSLNSEISPLKRGRCQDKIGTP